MTPTSAIEVSGLGKSYPGEDPGTVFRALADVNLSIAPGEFVSLIGPSGCGKTTLLKIIDGLIPYDEGELRVIGSRVTGPGPERAVVFQNFALLPWLTVRENVAFGLKMRSTPSDDRTQAADLLIEKVGLTGFANHYPAQLSGGMQQRVGLARALAVDPTVLLMDEPFSAVDAQTRTILQDDLLLLWQDSPKAVVFVTHAMDEAVFLSDRVVIMGTNPGRILETIDVDLPRPRTEESRRDPRFVELTSHVWQLLRGMILGETPK